MAMVMENQQPVAQTTMPQLVPAPPLPPPPPPPLPQAYKHHCKVCRKGFACGRALGGHMRAHGVADDDVLSSADDDDAGPCDDSSEAASPSAATNNKRMAYALRANPGRPKSCRVCENCGKEFTTWRSLLDHGRCDYDEEEDDMDGVRRSLALRDEDDDDDGEEVEADLALAAAGWSKGKRTRRGKVMEVADHGSVTEAMTSPSSEEEDLANCLVMLSSSCSVQPPPVVVESCALASKDRAESNRVLVPHPLSVMAPNTMMPEMKLLAPPQLAVSVSQPVPRGLFECKACKKVFTSHQALGGHRASHKKVKGCYAAKLESDRTEHQQPVVATGPKTVGFDDNADGNPTNSGTSVVVMATAALETPVARFDEAPAPPAGSPAKKKGKVHECSICHRVFMSGQALGGHKRCHWLTTGSAGDPTNGAVAKLHHPIVAHDHVMHAVCQQLTLGRPMLDDAAAHPTILDLNVPTNTSANARKQQQAAELLNESVLCLNAPAASLYMQSWTTVHSNNASNVNKTAATSSCNDDAAGGGAAATDEDEADSRNAKRGKIVGDLKDMNVAGETSPWLQVGIGLMSENKEKSIQE